MGVKLAKTLAGPVGDTLIQDSVITQKGPAKMNTQGKTNPTRKPQNQPSQATLSMAKDGRTVKRLLWLKIIGSASPELRTMLISYIHLTSSLDHLLPSTDICIVRHETLLDEINTAESLLTGVTPEIWMK